jgi:hypothetical protein
MTAKLTFGGVEGRDVYNITAPFEYEGATVIAGRVERRDQELSEIVLFREVDGAWLPLPDAPTFPGLQDPCIAKVDGRLLLGGVRFPVTVGDDDKAWQMEFYLDGEHVFTGPPKMKDIRFAQLPDGRLLVCSRPQGEKGGRGKIGYLVVDSLELLTPQAVQDAPLLEGLCTDEEWVGFCGSPTLTNSPIFVKPSATTESCQSS